jgi:two-component system chemotaxis response regulator CheB
MPMGCPPIVIVQHMAAPFTGPFARALDRDVPMSVREAGDGDDVRPGLCLVAPGNRHLRLVRHAGGYRVRLDDGPRVNRHRPSADVLFQSVAAAAGSRAIGVILTGMGDDGAAGLLQMRQAGALTIGQDEASCVVYGMPQQARRRGAVVQELPLDRIADAVLSALQESASRGA